MNTESCDMVRCPDEMDTDDMPIGGYNFHTTREGVRVMWVVLPGRHIGVLRLRPYSGPDPSWEMTGTDDKPTLSPSIHSIGNWHGWARNGRLESC